MSTVTIGCKLVNGLVIESGKPGTKDYRYVELNGAKPLPAPPKSKLPVKYRDGVTVVDAEVANAWFRANATLRYVIEGSVYIVLPVTVKK